MDTKAPIKSLGLWGAAVAITTGVINLFTAILLHYGVALDDAIKTDLINITLGVVTILSGGAAWHGRKRAKKVIKDEKKPV